MKKTLILFVTLSLCLNIHGQTNYKKDSKIPECYNRGNQYGSNYWNDEQMVKMLNNSNIDKYNLLKELGFHSGDSIIDEINRNQILITEYQTKIKNHIELTNEERNKVCEIDHTKIEYKYAKEIQLKQAEFYENQRIKRENQRDKNRNLIQVGNFTFFFNIQQDCYCGLTRGKTKCYTLFMREGSWQNDIYDFSDKFKCFSSASRQALGTKEVWDSSGGGDGLWSIVFFVDEDRQLIGIIRLFTPEIKKLIPDLENEYLSEVYVLKGDTVYVKRAKTKEEHSTIFNNNDLGKPYISIYNNEIYSLENIDKTNQGSKVLCKYKGNNKYEIAMLWFSSQFIANDGEKGKIIDKIIEIKSNEKQQAQNDLYAKKTKNCKYCNKPYKGVSFDIKRFTTGNKCGSDNFIEVYYDAFCSRKCAIDDCKSKND